MQIGVLVALGSAVLFGLSTPLAKILVGTVSPLLPAGLLYAGAGLGLSLLLAGRYLRAPRGTSISVPRRGEWLWLAGAILFGGVAGPVAPSVRKRRTHLRTVETLTAYFSTARTKDIPPSMTSRVISSRRR